MARLSYILKDGKTVTTSKTDSNIRIEKTVRENRTVLVVTAETEIELKSARIDIPWVFSWKSLIMANGYQSWTETRQFAGFEHLNNLNLRPRLLGHHFHFKSYGSQAFWSLPVNRLLGFDYSYVINKSREGDKKLFIGSRNCKNAYLLIWFDRDRRRITLKSDVAGRKLKKGESFIVFDFFKGEDGKEYFSTFRPVSNRKIFGYTSWYNHYQNINEKLILDALESTAGAGNSEEDGIEKFNLFQIDDGFETYVGDWLDIDPKKFPNGLKPIVDKIHDKGMMAGIWLAPFVAETDSKLAREHKDWIPVNKRSKGIYAGCNWSGQYALDLNRKEVVDYIRKVLRYYVYLGFDFFKLDFLYATNLKKLDGKTRAETAEFGYSILRQELEGKLILGCGATLSNAFEKFDYCRVGPDVSLSFDDLPYMRIFHPERISTKVTIQNTIFRKDLDGSVFLNDPDVFMLRDENNKLSKAQRKSLTLINAIFGSVLMTSDNTGSYSEEQKKILKEALNLFRNGEVLRYERRRRHIEIEYILDGENRKMTYNINKGTIR